MLDFALTGSASQQGFRYAYAYKAGRCKNKDDNT